MPELVAYIGLSQSAIYDRLNENSPRYDESFPKQVPLGGAVGWKISEIDQWIENCKNSRKRKPLRSTLQDKASTTRQSKRVATSRATDSNDELLSDDLAPKLSYGDFRKILESGQFIDIDPVGNNMRMCADLRFSLRAPNKCS